MLWHQAVNTDREVTVNRSRIIIKKQQRELAKGGGKKQNYKSFCIEIKRMWNLKCKTIPVITRATGIVKNGLRKNLEVTPGKHSIETLQYIAILGISHIIRRVLQSET